MDENTKVENVIRWFQNNKFTWIIALACVAIIFIATLTNALTYLRNFFSPQEVKVVVQPIEIARVSDVNRKIQTFRLSGPDPQVSLRFIAERSDIDMRFKASKTLKCSKLREALVNHFELLKSITINANISIKPTLVVNSLYVQNEDNTLEQQDIMDDDIVQIAFDYTGTASLNNYIIINDTLVTEWLEAVQYSPAQQIHTVAKINWDEREFFIKNDEVLTKQNMYWSQDRLNPFTGMHAVERLIDGKSVQTRGVF